MATTLRSFVREILGLPPEDANLEFPSSEAISAYAYSSDDKELYVTYNSGTSYTYHGVSPQRFRAFDDALSKGTYINKRVKPNYFYSRGL